MMVNLVSEARGFTADSRSRQIRVFAGRSQKWEPLWREVIRTLEQQEACATFCKGVLKPALSVKLSDKSLPINYPGSVTDS